MTIQFTVPPPPPTPIVIARPVEIPLESRQVAPAAIPPSRPTLASRDEQQNRTERERGDRESASQNPARSRGSQVDIRA
ncbi:MAG: hypothetical protein HY058_04195 [Proteobacteria bacterium]|nr:hypothetical protein [Pseudomonadota bacterium]